MRVFGPLLALALLLAALPSWARAATVQVVSAPAEGRDLAFTAVTVIGGPGVDRLTVSVAGDTVTIGAAEPPLDAPAVCTAADDRHVSCPLGDPAGIRGITVSGGAGDDRLVATGTFGTTLQGEDGDDVLEGSDGRDVLEGGVGRDAVRGNGGDDQLRLDREGAVAGEVFDGGAGRDTLLLDHLPTPVRVDLGAGTLSTGDATATVGGVEDVGVGSTLAVILGDDGPNRVRAGGPVRVEIDGRGGDDDLVGSSAPDLLVGGDGADSITFGSGDVVDGGPGDDALVGDPFMIAPKLAAPTLSCGDGTDTVGGTGPALVPTDCERLDMPGLAVAGLPRWDRGTVAVPLVLRTIRCGYTLQLRGPRTGIALTDLRRFRLGPVRNLTPHLRLTRIGRRLATRGALPQAMLVARLIPSCPRRGGWPAELTFRTLVALPAP